jgi:F0F1-type ATP synthase assembly protein I
VSEHPGSGPEPGGEERYRPSRVALTLAYVGTVNAVSVLLFLAAGWGLDRLLGTTPLFIFVGLPFGILCGIVATVRVVRDYLRQ